MPDTLGSRIKELRLKHAPGATLRQLIEWGRKGDPSIGNLRAIAKALGTTVEFLLTGEEE